MASLESAVRPCQRWSMDFIHDQPQADLMAARSGRYHSDNFRPRQVRAIELDTSISGERVVRVLERAKDRYGLPEVLVMDNGPEFTSKVMSVWTQRNRVKLHFPDSCGMCHIDPGKPVQAGQLSLRVAGFHFWDERSSNLRRWRIYLIPKMIISLDLDDS